MNMFNPLPIRLRPTVVALLLFSLLLGLGSARATNYNGYQIDLIRPGGDRPCTLFQLVGVAQADPVLPGSPWFSIPPTTQGYKEMVATLLSAKLGARNIDVITTGAVPDACGHPGVSVILMH